MKQPSDIGVAGLAVMGENLVLNIARHGFSISVYNRTTAKVDTFLEGRGRNSLISGFHTVEDFVGSLSAPRKILMMLKAGEVIDTFIDQLTPFLEQGDIIIDGGNSHYLDTSRRFLSLQKQGIHYIGSGVSGGEEGALNGPSLMPGGSRQAWPLLEPIFMAIAAKAPDNSPCCTWIGQGGAGHFVKMVHNGIEYGDMQLICESYQIMKQLLHLSADEIHAVFARWNRGDLKSYLIEITADIMSFKDWDGSPLVENIVDTAGQKGTGKWTASTALDFGTPLSLISESVFARCLSALKDQRQTASQILTGPDTTPNPDKPGFLKSLERALYMAKVISYAQGFNLLQAASTEFNWTLDYRKIARIWRGGCVIRSGFLDEIAAAFSREPNLPNLMLDSYFQTKIQSDQNGLREVLSAAVRYGVPVPCHASALSYFDGYRSARLPANLLQAQRDYFGAHMYERCDQPLGQFFHTDWTGRGGATTSTSYTS